MSYEDIQLNLQDRIIGVVAKNIGLDKMTIHNIANGKTKSPHHKVLKKLSDYLQQPLATKTNNQHYITDAMIEDAKKKTIYFTVLAHHEHNDCIRICYEWLDAQSHTKTATKGLFGYKHDIEAWAGRYVSTSDFMVAVTLHERFFIKNFNTVNISKKLIKPSIKRLEKIPEAFKHEQYMHFTESFDKYSTIEKL